MKVRITPVSLCLALAALLVPAGASAAIDEEAAKSLAKKNDCFKCHAVDKTKKGPSYKKIADKYFSFDVYGAPPSN